MLSELCVRRPVFATMLVMSLVVLGLFSFRDLGVDLFPKADPAQVNVSLRLPAIVTWPTPLTVWIARDTCLSASSVSVRRLIASDDIMSDITGSASGSTFVMTGGAAPAARS